MKSVIWQPTFQAENYDEAIAIAELLVEMNVAEIEIDSNRYPEEIESVVKDNTVYVIAVIDDELDTAQIDHIIETINSK